jgi:hypothetical protein
MSRHPVTTVWLLLVVATGASWWLGGGSAAASPSTRVATAVLLLVAFIKVRLIVGYFMEVRHAPSALRVGFDVWISLVCLALVVLYLRTPA